MDKLLAICDKNNNFDYIVNCIGITDNKIDASNSSSIIRAIEINAIFPHHLVELAQRKGMRVIHISTDGVFSGTTENYNEDTP